MQANESFINNGIVIVQYYFASGNLTDYYFIP